MAMDARRVGAKERLRGWGCGATVAAGLAVSVSACGGSGTLSHAQLLSKAAADCRKADVAAARLPAPSQSYSSLNQYARGLSPIVDTLIGSLTALKPAASDRGPLQGYVGALRGGDQGLRLLGSASSPAQVTQARSMIASQSLSAHASTLGVSDCGSAP